MHNCITDYTLAGQQLNTQLTSPSSTEAIAAGVVVGVIAIAVVVVVIAVIIKRRSVSWKLRDLNER